MLHSPPGRFRTQQLPHFDLNQKFWKMQEEGCFLLQVSQFCVGCCRARGRGKGRGCLLAVTLQVTNTASGQGACCIPWHVEAALLGSGGKGEHPLMLEEARPFPPEHLNLLPSFLL